MAAIIKRTTIALLLLFALLITSLFIPQISEKIVPTLITSAIKYIPGVSVQKIKYEKEKIILENVILKSKNNQTLNIQQIDLRYNIAKSIQKLALIFSTTFNNAKTDDSNHLNAEADIIYKYNSLEIENAKINFDDTSTINFNFGYRKSLGKFDEVYTDGKLDKISVLKLKKFLGSIFHHDALNFIQDYIMDGHVVGTWQVKLDKEFLHKHIVKTQHLTGQFKLLNISLKYDKDFPTLTDINSDVIMDGSKLHFQINQGTSNQISIIKGHTILDWAEGDDTKVLINAIIKGKASDVLDFVPRHAITDLQKATIDLTRIRGNLNGSVDIVVPLKPNTPNTYDVNTMIDHVSLSILEDNVNLSEGKLSGKFDGKQITIKGIAKVNEFSSKLLYQMNLDTNQDHDHILQLQITCQNLENQSITHGVNVTKGSSIVNLNYTKKDQKAKLTLDSELKNLEFDFDKIGMHKALGDKARLSIYNIDESPFPSKFAINLKGDNGLRLVGTAIFDHKSKELKFSEAKYGNTDLKADVIFTKDSMIAKVQGKSLDLSSSSMLHYLEKDSNGRATDLQIKIDNIILKQGIILDDFAMSIRCNNTQCFEGQLSSNIGARTLNMNLDTANNTEEWRIMTTNAGALLKGIGLYSNMKAGNLLMTLNTSRKEVHQGQQIPILEGHFVLEKFVTVKMPILTRLVSFISFPGLMSLVRNNRDVSFSKMSGTFSYKNNIIKINQCDADGGFFDFTAAGTIDTILHRIKLKGSVVPSLYGINTLVRNVPIIGKILSFGHRKGIVYAPYSIDEKY